MEFAGIRTIDDLRRIVMPDEVRQTLGWDETTEVEIFTDQDVIILERKKPNQTKDANPDMM